MVFDVSSRTPHSRSPEGACDGERRASPSRCRSRPATTMFVSSPTIAAKRSDALTVGPATHAAISPRRQPRRRPWPAPPRGLRVRPAAHRARDVRRVAVAGLHAAVPVARPAQHVTGVRPRRRDGSEPRPRRRACGAPRCRGTTVSRAAEQREVGPRRRTAALTRARSRRRPPGARHGRGRPPARHPRQPAGSARPAQLAQDGEGLVHAAEDRGCLLLEHLHQHVRADARSRPRGRARRGRSTLSEQ